MGERRHGRVVKEWDPFSETHSTIEGYSLAGEPHGFAKTVEASTGIELSCMLAQGIRMGGGRYARRWRTNPLGRVPAGARSAMRSKSCQVAQYNSPPASQPSRGRRRGRPEPTVSVSHPPYLILALLFFFSSLNPVSPQFSVCIAQKLRYGARRGCQGRGRQQQHSQRAAFLAYLFFTRALTHPRAAYM